MEREAWWRAQSPRRRSGARSQHCGEVSFSLERFGVFLLKRFGVSGRADKRQSLS
jgi:hypothetical protein